MEITSSAAGGKTVLHVRGRADINTSPAFEKSLMEPIQTGKMGIILDLTELDYIASAGLRVVLLAAKEIKKTGGTLVLCGLRENIRKVFEISGFLSIFTVKDTVAQALEG